MSGHAALQLKYVFGGFDTTMTADGTLSYVVGAAKGGHLDVLKYARENGCPWDSFVCAMAAENGH